MNISEAAKYLRRRLGLSQRVAASLMEVDYSHLCKMERGYHLPSVRMVEKYYEAFGIDLYMLAAVRSENESRIPPQMREVCAELREMWESEIESAIARLV
jgi:transcriptional regulator with XRE-family HTH domain